jgi:hypothetical protein
MQPYGPWLKWRGIMHTDELEKMMAFALPQASGYLRGEMISKIFSHHFLVWRK